MRDEARFRTARSREGSAQPFGRCAFWRSSLPRPISRRDHLITHNSFCPPCYNAVFLGVVASHHVVFLCSMSRFCWLNIPFVLFRNCLNTVNVCNLCVYHNGGEPFSVMLWLVEVYMHLYFIFTYTLYACVSRPTFHVFYSNITPTCSTLIFLRFAGENFTFESFP